MYAELVFPAGTTPPQMVRDVVRVITTSDGEGAANNGILEFADNINSNIVDDVASGWSLDPAYTLPTGSATIADIRYLVQQPHQNGSMKTVMIGQFNQNPSYWTSNWGTLGLSMGMVWNREAADPTNYMAYTHFNPASSTNIQANGTWTHTYDAVNDKTLLIWAQPRSIGMVTDYVNASGICTEGAMIAIVENVDTYESKWRGVAQPQQALFMDYYLPNTGLQTTSTNMSERYDYFATVDSGTLVPANLKYRNFKIIFQNMFWDRYNDRLMAMTYHMQYPSYAFSNLGNVAYNDNADQFGYWYRDETDSLGFAGFNQYDGDATSQYTRFGSGSYQAHWTGSTNTMWNNDGGSIMFGSRSAHNHWQYHTPKDANGDPAVVLTPVVYRVGDEARYQDFSSEAGFYYATPNFKDSEHMRYKFLTDAAGDTFLMIYSDYSNAWTAAGYGIKVS